MAFVIADRVRETTTTTGTGAVTLGGAYISFQSFATAIGNGNNTYYTIANPTAGEWEVGIGTYTSGTNTLSRDTVLASSNAGGLVNFSAGSKDVFVTQPAERSLLVQSAGTGLFAGAAAFTNNGVPYANSTSTLTTGSGLTFDGSTLTETNATSAANLVLNNTVSGKQTYINFTAGATLLNSVYRPATTNDFQFDANYGSIVWGIGSAGTASEQMRLTSTGLGIGTSNPLTKLVVSNAGAEGLEVSPTTGIVRLTAYNRSGGGYTSLSLIGTSGITQTIGSTGIDFNSQMLLNSSGNLGIGTSSPSQKLEVAGAAKLTGTNLQIAPSTTTSAAYLLNTNGGGNFFFGIDNSTGTSFTGTAYARAIYSGGAYPLVFLTNDLERMRLDASGNLGIGTSSPASKLSLYGTSGNSAVSFFGSGGSAVGYMGSTAAGNYIIGAAANETFIRSDGVGIAFSANTGSSVQMRLDSSGNLLAKRPRSNTAGDMALTVSPSDSTQQYGFRIDSNNNNLNLDAYTGSGYATRVILDSSGNLGLGVTPSAWSGFKNFEVGYAGTSISAVGQASALFSSNAYFNSGWKYGGTGAATYYYQDAGAHKWFTAASGNAGDPITFTQAMTLDASGRLGIGSTNPSMPLEVVGAGGNLSGTGYFVSRFLQDKTTYRGVALGYDTSGQIGIIFPESGGAASSLAFWTYTGSAWGERARIDSSGNFILGATSNRASSKLDIRGDVMTLGSNGSYYATIDYSAGAGLLSIAAESGGGIVFKSGTTERARIDSSGNFGIGTSSPQAYSGYVTLDVRGSTYGGLIQASDGTVKTTLYSSGSIGYSGTQTNHAYGFVTNGTERARIDSSGNLLVGTTGTLNTTNSGNYLGVGNDSYHGVGHYNSASGASFTAYYYNSGYIGGITQNGTTAVAYNTTSDYRLKDNQQPLTGSGAFIDALQPKTWNWKADGSKGVGFIAHEVQAVSPGSVVGEKDAVDEEGKPIMQAMEYGSAEFIANIIAELQSLRARVAQLESN